MTKLNNAAVLKEIRLAAKNNGLTFKDTGAYMLDAEKAYHFVNRETKAAVSSNLTLGQAYDRVCSGEISNYKAS